MDTKKWSEIASNVAIICLCVLIGTIAVKKFLLNDSAPHTLSRGTQLEVAGVDWSRADRTLVMVLSTHCHFCSESAGFYQRLVPAANTRKVQVVALLPQSSEEAQQYLASLQLPASGISVAQLPADAVQVSGTPTLIVVDKKGRVVRSWAGKLAPAGESEVMKLIQD